MKDLTINGGQNTITITEAPVQRDLGLETLCESVTIKLRPSEKAILEEVALKTGRPMSSMLRKIIFDYLDIQPALNEIHQRLEDILS